MLSRFDDFAIHQTPEPIAHPATGDRNAYDRYWFNGYTSDGEIYFAVAMGLYPNRGILDCGFSVVHAGEQHAFHGSRRASREPTDTQVGPFRIDILEPMRRARVSLEDNETGIACDLTFTARSACVEEGRQTIPRGPRVMMDATRFAQFGRWQGEIRIAGKRIAIDPARVYGTKDRSWGVRPVGEPESGGAPPLELPQIFFLWSSVNWGDSCSHFGVFEDANGGRLHSDGSRVPLYADVSQIPGVEDPGIERMIAVEHEIRYEKGTRRAESARLRLIDRRGQREEIDLEPILMFRMKGIGYTHPEWGHGRWKGELAIAGESWKTAEADPNAIDNQHIQQLMRARSGDRQGIGILEQIAIGPHARYGFKSLFDGAA